MTRRLVVTATLLTALLAACSASATPTVAPASLTIYGAASLKGALAAVEVAYETAVPGVTLTIATDSSSTLRTQIEQGAPADVFLSADRKNPQALVDEGLADGEVIDFAGNRLTIIVPADNPAGITSPADLATPGTKVVAAGDEVPITAYAQQAVANLGTLAGYPARFAEGYASNIVSKEENVSAVVAKIALGEGDAAIVYVTDAAAADDVATVAIPAESNVPATYAGIVVGTSTLKVEGRAFLDWLAGAGGRAVLSTFGFLPPT